MSDYRHAAIFKDTTGGDEYWLNIVRETPEGLISCPSMAVTIGPFPKIQAARDYADANYQNTGYVIPYLAPLESVNRDIVCMHYVLTRLNDPDGLRQELLHNIGVNAHARWMDQDD
jgi:hypothetical protein